MIVFYEFLDFLKRSCFEENLSLDVTIYTSWQNNIPDVSSLSSSSVSIGNSSFVALSSEPFLEN